jgi:polysaccharide deacetylase family protein (PEP-CTERM system associated)
MMSTSHLLISIDVEDHTGRYAPDARYITNTYRYLEYLALHQQVATFFTVGRIAEHAPLLVRDIAEAGHEVACHSYDHTPLTLQSAEQFTTHTRKAKMLLEQASGKAVTGYRAPIFSLTANTPHVPHLLQELGFSYSSSILPAAHPLYGYAGLPSTPFRWPCGLIELPVVTASIAGAKLPFLGGIYLRYLPRRFVQRLLQELPEDALPWTYLHPYDIDHTEQNWRMQHTALWACILLWFNRKSTLAKLDALRPYFKAQTFAQAASTYQEAAIYNTGN